MTGRNPREHRRISNSQILNPMHPQVRVHHPAVLLSRHTTRYSGVIQRLGALAHLCLQLSVREAVESVIEQRVVVMLEYRGQGLGLYEAQDEFDTAHEDGDVVFST